jgi:8-oxo-dGTP pyrophosphatase MutT (NUDIX family)
LIEAARRECAEETGLDVTVQRLLATARADYEHGRLELYFFACHPRDPSAELRLPFAWVSLASLRQLRFPPANATILDILQPGGQAARRPGE